MLCKYGKRKLQLADYQLTAILRSCLGRTIYAKMRKTEHIKTEMSTIVHH